MTQMTLPQAFELAMKQQAAGNLAAAESIYRQLLAAVPDHPDALHMLGVLAMQAGKPQLAIELIERSIRVNPNQAGYHANRAQALTIVGRIDDAIQAYRQALSIQPDLVEANNNLGHLYRRCGQMRAAAEHFRSGVAARPESAELWTFLAITLADLNDFPASVEAWRKVTELDPANPDAVNNLGNALQEMGQFDPAIDCYHRALALRPQYPEANNNLGNAYLRSGRPQSAAECFQKALNQKSDYAEAYRGLGNSLKHCDRYDEAIAAHERSITLQPLNVEAHSDLGATLHATARFEAAAERFEHAIALSPNFPEAHFNLGLSLLLRGKLEQGWIEHEWRAKVASHIASKIQFPIPPWRGEPIEGKRLLLFAEQGFGDTLMAIRYLPLAAARGAKISFICPSELSRLLGNVPGIDKLIIPADEFPKVQADVQCSLMSLPGIFKTTLDTIPAQVPYLKADPALVDQYRDRVKDSAGRLKVGVVWNGRPLPDPKRSISLDLLSPLAQVRNARFYSLQFGPAANVPRPADLEITDITQGASDFADSAALIENLDLILTIDTATAHLAGALGKPTFTLLPWVPDWRWLLDREDSPWYPTMKLFRQERLNDWSEAVARVVRELAAGTHEKE